MPRYGLRPQPQSYVDFNASRYTLAANVLKIMEVNSVTHPEKGQGQVYRCLVKGQDKEIW